MLSATRVLALLNLPVCTDFIARSSAVHNGYHAMDIGVQGMLFMRFAEDQYALGIAGHTSVKGWQYVLYRAENNAETLQLACFVQQGAEIVPIAESDSAELAACTRRFEEIEAYLLAGNAQPDFMHTCALNAERILMLLDLPYAANLLDTSYEAGGNGWTLVTHPEAGRFYLRADDDDYFGAIGLIDEEGKRVWAFILGRDEDTDAIVVTQRLQQGLENGQMKVIDADDEATLAESRRRLDAFEAWLWRANARWCESMARIEAIEVGRPLHDVQLDPNIWQGWVVRAQAMQRIAQQQGWEVIPLSIAPPATEAQVATVEAAHGLRIPGQLRTLWTGFSAEVQFEWWARGECRPGGKFASLYNGGIRGVLWSLPQTDEYAIGNFQQWKLFYIDRFEAGGAPDEYECPNPPELWENQFGFAHLRNGDMLTIDTRDADPAKQPVRYFSHEIEGIHGAVLAPNLYAFIDAWTRLGCVGDEQHQWFDFLDENDRLDAGGEFAKAWRAWLGLP